MTRRLRMAGMGLCAFMLPACSSTSGSKDLTDAGSGTGYVVMDRPGGSAPKGLRQQIAEGKVAPPANEVLTTSQFGPSPPATLDGKTVAADPPTVKPPIDMLPPVAPPKTERLVAVAPPSAPLVIPVKSEIIRSVSNPNAFPQPDGPVVAPAWPNVGAASAAPAPFVKPVDTTPRVDALPDIKPPDGLPLAEISAPPIVAPNASGSSAAG